MVLILMSYLEMPSQVVVLEDSHRLLAYQAYSLVHTLTEKNKHSSTVHEKACTRDQLFVYDVVVGWAKYCGEI